MDKSRMTFKLTPSRDEVAASTNAKPFREHRSLGYRRKSPIRPKRYNHNDTGGGSRHFQLSWLIPAVLATITGVALGLGILFLFRSTAADSKPSVTSTPTQAQPAPVASANAAPQTLQSVSFIAYQVGVFGDQDRAKKGAAELEKIGLHPVLRMADQVQLLVGVAVDKTQGQAVADALTKQEAHFYLKEYTIPEKKGVMEGIASKDAAALTNILAQSMQIMKDGIVLSGQQAPRKEAVDAWIKRVHDLNGQAAAARKVLDSAGRKGELVRFDDIQQQLNDASVAMSQGKPLLEVQQHFAQSVVDYEELANKLISTQ